MENITSKDIIIHGARENNLKNININIPLNKSNVVIGVSGSGKSSLVYDVIFKESQRAFLENLNLNISSNLIATPADVEKIENLPAAFSVSQHSFNKNPRSTLGTFTDISKYLRSIFSIIINDLYQENLKDNDFSSNNPKSCCSKCNGTGIEYFSDISKIIPDKFKTLNNDALPYFSSSKNTGEFELLKKYCLDVNIPMDKPLNQLSKIKIDQLLYSTSNNSYELRYKNAKGKYRTKKAIFKGAVLVIEENLKDINKPSVYKNIHSFIKVGKCSCCKGLKLNNKLLNYKILNKNISEVENLNLNELLKWLTELSDNYKSDDIEKIVDMISKKINSLIKMKLNYLSLSRTIPSLSGGELQRVRISNQLNNPLIGVMYIFDEPCKGLHHKDLPFIINGIKSLIEKNNTIISIEHNYQFISEMDNIIYMGPSGGTKGGQIISKDEFEKLNDIKQVDYKKRKNKDLIIYKKINKNNLIDFKCTVPTRGITALVGVSGTGKSTLLHSMYNKFQNQDYILQNTFDNTELTQMYLLNQQPIHKNKKSKIVTYLDVFDNIRRMYAEIDLAKTNNFDISYFSFNSDNGKCNKCNGIGEIKMEMSFLQDIYVKCDDCNGTGYNNKVLDIEYKGYNIAEFLNLELQEVVDLIPSNNVLYKKLKILIDLGLNYVKLNQTSMSLSGGEAQRIKLAKVLGKTKNEGVSYLLDEPTTGLSKIDINRLSKLLHKISEKNQVIVIEHNEEFIKSNVDYIVDLGTEGGSAKKDKATEGFYDEIISNSSIGS